MPQRPSFERRLLLALVLFSVIPSVLLIWGGSYLVAEVLELHASGATFERIAASGRDLLSLAEQSGDEDLTRAAARHRAVLSSSLMQSGRWDYLNERVLGMIPYFGVLLAAFLMWLAVRAARGIARELARPINELVGWAGVIARDEPLPAERDGDGTGPGELAALRRAFRAMASELAASRERAIETERARTWVTMARSVAHELKNSLTPLRLAARSLQARVGDAPETREPIEVIAEEAERLDALARAFSQFGRLPEGPLSEVDVVELLEHLLRTHLPAEIDRRLVADPEVPHVHGHHEVLSRAFANVLLNAGEAVGGADGAVEVVVTHGTDGVTIVIRDSGPGICAEDLDRVWDPDFTTKARGTGLGLALVRQAVHAHRGSIGIANSAAGGAEITITLPVGAGPAPVEPAASTEWRPS